MTKPEANAKLIEGVRYLLGCKVSPNEDDLHDLRLALGALRQVLNDYDLAEAKASMP
ncbi:MAG: hypothetical protein KGL39_55560 [Patescibacteria group bacterium]|nr:hypothetical protein [Patescibacteria group bacterium]